MDIFTFWNRFAKRHSSCISRKVRKPFRCRHELETIGIYVDSDMIFNIVYYLCFKCNRWFKSGGYSLLEQEKSVHPIDEKDVPQKMKDRVEKKERVV